MPKVATITENDDGTFTLNVEGMDHPRDTYDQLLADIAVVFGPDATVDPGGAVVLPDPPPEPAPAPDPSADPGVPSAVPPAPVDPPPPPPPPPPDPNVVPSSTANPPPITTQAEAEEAVEDAAEFFKANDPAPNPIPPAVDPTPPTQ
jgi:hypothetical protein